MVYTQREVNLHTHTFYSGHGTGTALEMAEAAAAKGIKVLGLSEHSPKIGYDFIVKPWSHYSWMNWSDLENYTYDVKQLRDNPSPDLPKILLGCECEWRPDHLGFYKEELLGRLGYDYVLMGIHFIENDTGKHYIGNFPDMPRYLSKYVKDYTDGLESGIFLFGAHPDLFASGFPVWNEDAKAATRDIIACAKDLDIPLEVNDYAFRKPLIGNRRAYTVDEFWTEALAAGVRICTNSDAHNPKDIFCSHTFEYAEELGIKYVSWDVSETAIKAV